MNSDGKRPAHRMDPRDPRRPGRAAQDHRRRGARRAWPRHRCTSGNGDGRASPQPRARRLRHQSGPSARQEGRGQPARIRRLARRRTHRRRRHRLPPTWPDPASSTCASPPRPRASSSTTSSTPDDITDTPRPCENQKINLEFVSANPTGPIHIGGTRWAAVGDALGRLLASQGAEIVREYYFNDHGAQIDRFTNSLIAAARGYPPRRTATRATTSPTSPRRCSRKHPTR